MKTVVTQEICCNCDQPTGLAGRQDDSLFVILGDEEYGPLCEECYKELIER